MYDAENRLIKALPKMVKAATHAELKDALESHLAQTQQQVTQLQKVFKAFGKTPKGKTCEAMVGLIKEAEEIVSDNQGEPALNAAIISAAQKVEHYEIASYGCLREWAEQLGNTKAEEILKEILDEEKDADQALTDCARESCNEEAGVGGESEEKPARKSTRKSDLANVD